MPSEAVSDFSALQYVSERLRIEKFGKFNRRPYLICSKEKDILVLQPTFSGKSIRKPVVYIELFCKRKLSRHSTN